MPNLVQELNSLDFNVYIGGPLQAAVQAQHAASMSQVNFIKEVGFDQNTNDLRYVAFKYKKVIPNPHLGKTAAQLAAENLPANTDTTSPTINATFEVSVPFLTMLTVPALRIDEMTIDFNAKLTSTETANVSSEFAANAELAIKYKIVNFKASASYKRTSSSGVSTERTYNLGVRVRAVNDELPAGLDRILTMLESEIKEKKI